jgi:hypothetical protein
MKQETENSWERRPSSKILDATLRQDNISEEEEEGERGGGGGGGGGGEGY